MHLEYENYSGLGMDDLHLEHEHHSGLGMDAQSPYALGTLETLCLKS